MALKSSVERAEQKVGGFATARKKIVIQYQGMDKEESDILDAILQLIQNAFSSRLFSFEISGTDALIPWNDLNIEYDAEKNYAAIVTPAGNYEEFLPFGTECKSDGLHIYPHRLINGKIVSGTRHKKWGKRKWGVGKWNDYDSMKVNLQFAEVES